MHNDYVELGLEGGVVGLGLAAWLAWGFWRRAVRGAGPAGQRDPAALGLLLGLGALSLHALVDFNHQIPAVGLLFTATCAMVVARGEASAPERRP